MADGNSAPAPVPPVPPAPLDPAALRDYTAALEQLHDLLDDAYWVATTIEAKDALNGLSQAVFDILTTLHGQAIQADTPEYVALKATVIAVNAKLQKVQGQIDDWIHKINVAGQVVAGMAQAIALAAKVFTF